MPLSPEWQPDGGLRGAQKFLVKVTTVGVGSGHHITQRGQRGLGRAGPGRT